MLRNVISILLLSAQLTAQDKHTISGKILFTTSYCGGPAPSKEMLEEHATPRPYTGKTLYVKKGKVNLAENKVILSFKADEKGNFSFNLPPGEYSVVQLEQTVKLNAAKLKKDGFLVDETCLKTWWKKPYYTFVVKDKNITGLTFTFHHLCSVANDIECVRYLPPLYP